MSLEIGNPISDDGGGDVEGEVEVEGDDVAGRSARAAWVERGRSGPLERWLDRVLDREGVPRRIPVRHWGGILARLDAARRERADDWPDLLDARIEGLFRATLRFARAKGAPVFAPPDARADATVVPPLFRRWAARLSDPGLATVVDWWFPPRAGIHEGPASPPPLPAWSGTDRPLAILRSNWSGRGDFLAVDHRERGDSSLVELSGFGRTWLGPTWTTEPGAGTTGVVASRPRPSLWASSSSADLFEWTFLLGPSRVTRTALILRGRRIALLADQVEGPCPRAGWRLTLPNGVDAAPAAEGRGWVLSTRGMARGPSARVFPLALPRLAPPGAADRGRLALEAGQLHLSQPNEGRRCWLPLLASWDPARNRQSAHWRVVTVAEKGRACSPATAFGARISWGRGETLLVYRSLAPPALRSVLGHQTRSRFLVGLFNKDGDVTPIVRVE